MDAAIAELQRRFLDDDQISSSRAIMGIDTQLIDDGTYFVVESEGGSPAAVAGAVGRPSTAATHARSRQQAARPDGRPGARAGDVHESGPCPTGGRPPDPLTLRTAAASEGFTRLELMSTLSGEPLYTAYGFRPLERLLDATGGAPVPIIRMDKPVDPSLFG